MILIGSRIQPGLRRSRNAVSPSRASAPARTRAIQRAVSMIIDSSPASLRPGHAAEQALDLGLRLRAAGEQRVVRSPSSPAASAGVVNGLVHEPDAHRGRRVHRLAGQEPAMGLALSDGADHVGRDHRGHQAEADLGEREPRARARQCAMSQAAMSPTAPP